MERPKRADNVDPVVGYFRPPLPYTVGWLWVPRQGGVCRRATFCSGRQLLPGAIMLGSAEGRLGGPRRGAPFLSSFCNCVV